MAEFETASIVETPQSDSCGVISIQVVASIM
jgi:hypothetical protein